MGRPRVVGLRAAQAGVDEGRVLPSPVEVPLDAPPWFHLSVSVAFQMLAETDVLSLVEVEGPTLAGVVRTAGCLLRGLPKRHDLPVEFGDWIPAAPPGRRLGILIQVHPLSRPRLLGVAIRPFGIPSGSS